MKHNFLYFIFFFVFSLTSLKAQEKNSDFLNPVIKKIKETFVALLKSLKPSEGQKKQAQGIMNEIKEYYDILKESIPDLPPSEEDQNELKLLRDQIDHLDHLSIECLSFIMDEVLKIAVLKKNNNLPPFSFEDLKSFFEIRASLWNKFENLFFSVNKANNLNDFQKNIQELVVREIHKLEIDQLNKLFPFSSSHTNKKEIEVSKLKIKKFYSQLITNLNDRMKVVVEVGQWKKKHKEIPFQAAKWKETLRDRINKGAIKGLSKNFIENFMHIIHAESLRIQERVINDSN